MKETESTGGRFRSLSGGQCSPDPLLWHSHLLRYQWPRATSNPHSSSQPPQMSAVRHIPVNAFLARLGVHFWQVPPARYLPQQLLCYPDNHGCALSNKVWISAVSTLSPEGSGCSIYVDPSLFTSSWPIPLLCPSPVVITNALYYSFLLQVLGGFPS